MSTNRRVSYHEVIGIFEGNCPIEVREEDELGVLERPVHGFQLGRGDHLEWPSVFERLEI